MGAIVRLDVPKPPVNVWVEAICIRWTKGLDAVFDTGQTIADARAALPHGEFEEMIRDRLPFTPATARKLMTIVAKTMLTDRSIRNVLPAAWTVLYELTHIDDSELERWFAEGKIRPSLTAREVLAARVTRSYQRHPRLVPTLPPPPAPEVLQPQAWADKVIDTLQTLVRQFDGVDLAAVQRGAKHQQVRDLATLIRSTRNWFDVLELSKEEKRK